MRLWSARVEKAATAIVKDAASVGFYVSVAGKKFSRVQHPDYEPDLNFMKAKAESHSEQQPLI